ncbi:MarR family winged helix-turn-helix transcriptional regulator [Cellulomonas cellasea]|uniref:DNA-binding MarR family transcriptional regulator n=1 Tax=Cellulomonas cellasea TaxID=43670 RepID=A0A7W4YD32_9CELL|nr:MarR family transcriptional regulator [Cellulomonas cellasea]MBB2924146.1 DNA-binding MarR family transcriptional regulator [Cellulomonas cellasea]
MPLGEIAPQRPATGRAPGVATKVGASTTPGAATRTGAAAGAATPAGAAAATGTAGAAARPAPTAKQCRPENLAGELRIGIFRSARRLRAERGAADLPDHQFSVLAWIHMDGPMTPGALAERQHVQPPSMTRTVNALAELGFVTKAEHPNDGRQVVVSLTEKGAAEVTETRRRRDQWLTRRLTAFTPAERATLAEAAQLLRRLAAE